MLAGLERRFGRWAVPHAGMVLALGQAIVWIAGLVVSGSEAKALLKRLALDPAAVAQGELWRLASFLFVPPSSHPLWVLLGLWFLWWVGGALEARWGAFRLNCYLAIGWLATIAVAMAGYFLLHQPGVVPGALYLVSLFLAFAWLFPDFTILLFFIIPVKAKWLALVAWIGLGLSLVLGDTWGRLLVLAMVANWLAFFGGEALRRLRRGSQVAVAVAKEAVVEDKPFHRCAGCGATERSHPDRRFRVCTDCRPAADWCTVCLKDHHH